MRFSQTLTEIKDNLEILNARFYWNILDIQEKQDVNH